MPPSTQAQPPLSSSFTTTTGRSHPANPQHRRLSALQPSELARRRPAPRTAPSTEVPGPLAEIRRFHGAGCPGSSAPTRGSPRRRTARPSAHDPAGTPALQLRRTQQRQVLGRPPHRARLSHDPQTRAPLLGGRELVVLASRSGGYAEGTPRHGWDHAQPWLPHAISLTGLEPRFITAELPPARTSPAMAELIPLADQSLADAEHAIDALWAPVPALA